MYKSRAPVQSPIKIVFIPHCRLLPVININLKKVCSISMLQTIPQQCQSFACLVRTFSFRSYAWGNSPTARGNRGDLIIVIINTPDSSSDNDAAPLATRQHDKRGSTLCRKWKGLRSRLHIINHCLVCCFTILSVGRTAKQWQWETALKPEKWLVYPLYCLTHIMVWYARNQIVTKCFHEKGKRLNSSWDDDK